MSPYLLSFSYMRPVGEMSEDNDNIRILRMNATQ